MHLPGLIFLLFSIAPGLLQPGDFTYLGAFALPTGSLRPETFEYGGEAMTFLCSGDTEGEPDGYPGSLLIAGHGRMPCGELPDGCMVAEVSIPVPVVSNTVSGLNRAEPLQPFSTVDNGIFSSYDEIPRMGMEYLTDVNGSSMVHVCFGQHLEQGQGPTHGVFNPDLSNPDLRGGWHLANTPAYSANDYLFAIPLEWAEKYTGGRLLATGRFRDGGWSGMGPSLYAYFPTGESNGVLSDPGVWLSTVALLQYGSSEGTDDLNRSMEGYQHPDEWTGGAWLTTESGESAVLFAGTKGTGDLYWYGYASPSGPEHPMVEEEMRGEFILCRRADGEPFQAAPAQLEPSSMRGWWSSSFSAGFLLYDPADLGRVATGEMETWEPQPYQFISIDSHLFLNPQGIEEEMLGRGSQRRFRLGDAAWDKDNGLLYVLELFAEGAAPVVHVWRVRRT